MSPLQNHQINFHGRYAFTSTGPSQGLRPLRDRHAEVDTDSEDTNE